MTTLLVLLALAALTGIVWFVLAARRWIREGRAMYMAFGSREGHVS